MYMRNAKGEPECEREQKQ